MFSWIRQRRRAAIRRTPFPAAWLPFLERRVPHYSLLDPAEQKKLRDDLRIFLSEKHWEGCAGLELTDEMRVTISAWACLLVLAIDHDYFSRVKSILVYPRGYMGPEASHGGLVGAPSVRLGEAWYRGPVILSWFDVVRGGKRGNPCNVVLHEFAHQLDMLDRVVDGTPPLPARESYRDWTRIMTDEYHRLADDWEAGRATVLDPYGTTSEGEFFAVATEAFFQLPFQLREHHPRLYELLRNYYRQDPALRLSSGLTKVQ